jgi:hypothetical protein
MVIKTINMKLDQNIISLFIKTNHVHEHLHLQSPFFVEVAYHSLKEEQLISIVDYARECCMSSTLVGIIC